MRILRYHVWNRTLRGQQEPVKRSAGDVAEFGKVTYRYRLLIVVEKGILTVYGKAQEFVDLVACSNHKTLEIQRIIGELVIGHEPLEHAECRYGRFWNVVVAEQIKADLPRLAVVQN